MNMVGTDKSDRALEMVLKELQEKGISITPRGKTAGRPECSSSKAHTHPGGRSDGIGQVLTEEKVNQLYENSSSTAINVPASVVITPSAKDRIKDLGLKIIQS